MLQVFGRDLVAASYVGANNMEGYVKYAQKVAWLGFRPTLPERLPAPLHNLICACWHKDAAKRPSFASIVSALGSPEMRAALRALDVADNESRVDTSSRWRDLLPPGLPVQLPATAAAAAAATAAAAAPRPTPVADPASGAQLCFAFGLAGQEQMHAGM